MRPLYAICLVLLIAAISTETWARREALTPEQKSKNGHDSYRADRRHCDIG